MFSSNDSDQPAAFAIVPNVLSLDRGQQYLAILPLFN